MHHRASKAAEEGPGGSRHARRVFAVLQAFADLGGSVHTPGEISRITGIDDSAVHRILRSGVRSSMFVQVSRGLYRLGPAAVRIGLRASAQNEPESDGN